MYNRILFESIAFQYFFATFVRVSNFSVKRNLVNTSQDLYVVLISYLLFFLKKNSIYLVFKFSRINDIICIDLSVDSYTRIYNVESHVNSVRFFTHIILT